MQNIFLIGPMGAGKTTIGRSLAKSLNCQFLDSDHVIEEKCGANIPWIFDVEGETGFRQREADVIAELCRYNNIVLATGGGVVLTVQNRECLQQHGTVVYLRSPVEVLVQRTAHDSNRPLLQSGDPAQALRDMIATREPLYLEIADIIIDTDKNNARGLVHEIIQYLNKS